jgi:hypothetical protein
MGLPKILSIFYQLLDIGVLNLRTPDRTFGLELYG